MRNRESSAAYAALTSDARRVHAIETAIGDGSTVVVSYYDFHLDQGIEPRKVSPALRLLDCLGLIDIEPGRARGGVRGTSGRLAISARLSWPPFRRMRSSSTSAVGRCSSANGPLADITPERSTVAF